MAYQLPRQELRRWGNSLGVRLSAAIARETRLSLAERLASYTPMEGKATEAMAWDPIGTEVIE